MTTWTYPSKSGPGTYTTTLHDNGKFECDCKGFRIKREGQPRKCRHIEDVIKKNNLTTRVEDVYLVVDYSLAGQSQQLVLPVQEIDYKDHYETAHANGYVEPMLASAMTKRPKDEPWEVSIRPYQDGNWVSEVKYDGIRVVLAKNDDTVHAWSRPRPGEGSIGKPRRLAPHIVQAIKDGLPNGTYDGEQIVGDTAKSYHASRLDQEHNQCLVLFDILKLGNENLLSFTYAERRVLLGGAFGLALEPSGVTCIKLAEAVSPSADHIKGLWDKGAEGVILKKLTSIYRPGWRSPDWVKIKLEGYATGTVIGYEAAKNGPYSKVLLRADDGVETSVKTKDNYWLREFAANPEKYIGKRLVFKHYGRTDDNKYRGPIIWDHWAGEGE